MPVSNGSSALPRTPERSLAALVLLLVAACTAAPAPPATPAPFNHQPSPPPPDTVAVAAPEESLAPPPPEPVRAALPVRLSFTGDINLGTSTLPGGIPPDQGRGLLDPIDSLLTGNLVIGNLEGVLADSGTTTKCDVPGDRPRAGQPPRQRSSCYVFLTPTRLAPRLKEAGFTHLNLANNHSHDYGVAGRISTEQTLRSLGLKVYGPLGQISIDTVRSGDSLTVIGLIGFSTYPSAANLLDLAASAALVDSITQIVDLVVVTFHGGNEGTGALNVARGPEFLGREPRGDLRQWARVVIDAGADLVVGHGPHVLRGIEFYRDRPVVYSLGNFLTYRGFNLQGPLGLTGVLQVELDGEGGFRTGRFHSMVQLPRQGPSLDTRAAAIGLMRRLSLEDFGSSAARFLPDGTIIPPEPPSP